MDEFYSQSWASRRLFGAGGLDPTASTERLEIELSELACQADDLTGQEIDVMWQTAPPRVPAKKKREGQ